MKDIKRLRYFVEMQGYTGQTDEAISQFGPWLRVAPAVCAAATGLATLSGEWKAFAMLVPMAVLGAMLPYHPFDAFYQLVWAPEKGTAQIPDSGLPKRFSCAVAAAWLCASASALAHGNAALGTGLGWAFVATALIPALTDFCVPSYLWAVVLRLPVSRGVKLGRLATAK